MVTVALTPALIAALSGSALAADGEVTDVAVRDDVTDRATDEVIDLPTDVVTDRPTDVLTDRPTDVVTDRPTDTPNDRCRQKLVDRRCVSDRPTDRPVDRCLLTTDHPRPHRRPPPQRLELSQADLAANSCPRVGEAGTTTSCTRLALTQE